MKQGTGGVATNAVYGVCRTLQQLRAHHFPGCRLIAVFDHPADSFRSELLPSYKAQVSSTIPNACFWFFWGFLLCL